MTTKNSKNIEVQNQLLLNQDESELIIPATLANNEAGFFSSPHGERNGFTPPPPSPRRP